MKVQVRFRIKVSNYVRSINFYCGTIIGKSFAEGSGRGLTTCANYAFQGDHHSLPVWDMERRPRAVRKRREAESQPLLITISSLRYQIKLCAKVLSGSRASRTTTALGLIEMFSFLSHTDSTSPSAVAACRDMTARLDRAWQLWR